MKFSEFVEINPKIEMEKGEEYEFVEMADVTPGNKYVYSRRKRKLRGGVDFNLETFFLPELLPVLSMAK